MVDSDSERFKKTMKHVNVLVMEHCHWQSVLRRIMLNSTDSLAMSSSYILGLVGLRGSRLLGLLVLLALGLLLVSVKPAFSCMTTPTPYCTVTNTVSPSSPTVGVPFTIQNNQYDAGLSPGLTIYYGFGCSGTVLYTLGANFFGDAIITIGPTTPGLSVWPIPAGQYSSLVSENPPGDNGPACVDFTIIPAATSTTTSAPPIPEYPLGLPILAILTIFAYCIIRRRTRNDKT
jgi:hypothetical protein